MTELEKLLKRADNLLDGEYYSASEVNDLVSGLVEALSDMTEKRDRWHAMWRAVMADYSAFVRQP